MRLKHVSQAMSANGADLLRHKFVPNLISNVVFLLSTIQSVSVSLVNFKGRPFMRGKVFLLSDFSVPPCSLRGCVGDVQNNTRSLSLKSTFGLIISF